MDVFTSDEACDVLAVGSEDVESENDACCISTHKFCNALSWKI